MIKRNDVVNLLTTELELSPYHAATIADKLVAICRRPSQARLAISAIRIGLRVLSILLDWAPQIPF